jgi:hypothetical protein
MIRAVRGQQRFRDGEAEGFGGLEVDDQFDLCHLLHRQIGWFLAPENAPGINANLVSEIADAAAIAHQATGQSVHWVKAYRTQRLTIPTMVRPCPPDVCQMPVFKQYGCATSHVDTRPGSGKYPLLLSPARQIALRWLHVSAAMLSDTTTESNVTVTPNRMVPRIGCLHL